MTTLPDKVAHLDRHYRYREVADRYAYGCVNCGGKVSRRLSWYDTCDTCGCIQGVVRPGKNGVTLVQDSPCEHAGLGEDDLRPADVTILAEGKDAQRVRGYVHWPADEEIFSSAFCRRVAAPLTD